MKSIKRIRKTQPATKKKVIELEIGGWLGRKLNAHNWGAFTWPFAFIVLILYWSTEDAPDGDVNAFERVHEFTHVAQDEKNLFFLVTWVKYFWSSAHHLYWRGWGHISEMLMDAYYANDMEVEAYAVEHEAEENGLPPWAL
jgi:hypothetical protein